MRECRRVLKPGGRLASVVIEPAQGLDDQERARSLELGPGSMSPDRTLEETTGEAGLLVLATEDWTVELEATLRQLVEALLAHEDELRRVEGDEVFEHEMSKKRRLLEGVECGLLKRTLVVAEAP